MFLKNAVSRRENWFISLIKNKTVIVVGAGASADLNLPLGPQLRDDVSELLSGANAEMTRYFVSAVHHLLGTDSPEASSATMRARELSGPLRTAASIDNFLDQHKSEQNFVETAKMAIAYAIASAEKNSKIGKNRSAEEVIRNSSDYFLADLMNIVVRGHQADNIGDSLDNLTFVIFNYDRCVERYLDSWMKFRFGCDFEWRQRGPKFIHVYGSLGDYFETSIHNPFLYQGDMAFQNPHLQLPAYVERIKVFTEQEDSLVHGSIVEAVGAAKALLFFGFGFEEQNMRFFQGNYDNKKLFATLYGVSKPNTEFLRDQLTQQYSFNGRWVYTCDGTAKKLISEYYHPMTKAVGSL